MRMMTRSVFGIVVAFLVCAGAAATQGTGLIRGIVKDNKGQPIEGATVTITTSEEVNRRFQTKTDRSGSYVQVGLPTGTYTVVVEKDKLSATQMVRVSNGGPSDANFVLAPAIPAPTAATAPAGGDGEFQKAFNDGLEAARAKNVDDAIAKFNRALELNPTCAECKANLATLHFGKGLALWYADKAADAKAEFDEAIKANPNHAEAHFQLAMALVNQAKFSEAAQEFDTYLKLAPDGPNAAQAKTMASQLPKK